MGPKCKWRNKHREPQPSRCKRWPTCDRDKRSMNSTPSSDPMTAAAKVPLFTIAREWTRLGCVGFSGPPAHIALLRRLCVEDRKWIEPSEFEDAIASVNLLPGPASTQLAIFCAWRLRKTVGALLGGICFIAPGLVLILVLSALFLAHDPPSWILGAAAGGGAAVPAVALHAAAGFVPASWRRIGALTSQRIRWVAYGLVGGAVAATVGPIWSWCSLSVG